MPADRALEDIAESGYHIAENIISPAEAASVREQLEPLLADTSFGANSFVGRHTKRIHSVFGHTRAVDDLAINPLVLDVVGERLGDCLLSASVVCEIHPGESAQAAHTDDGIYPLPSDHRDVALTALWAIDDFTADNGGTIVFPGRFGDRDTRPYASEGVAVEMPAGSVMLYTGTLWHGGGANITTTPRLALILTYVESWLRPQDSHLISVPIERARTLPPRLRSLLGYSMRPPFLGYVDGEDPGGLFDDAPPTT